MINPVDISTTMFNMQGKKIEAANSFSEVEVSGDKDKDLKKAAANFEAVFVAKFLETMNKTVEKGDFMNGGHAEETFKALINQEMALSISSNPSTSFGFAEQIYKQMKDRV